MCIRDRAKQIAMQIAAMNPIAVDEDGVSEEIKQKEIDVAIEKTKACLLYTSRCV